MLQFMSLNSLSGTQRRSKIRQPYFVVDMKIPSLINLIMLLIPSLFGLFLVVIINELCFVASLMNCDGGSFFMLMVTFLRFLIFT